MKEFNFNSQVCTDRIQSDRLLALGLKIETADMHHSYYTRVSFDGSKSHFWKEETGYNEKAIPAWSLHRLIEMLNIQMQTDGRYIYLADGGFDAHNSIYDNIIDCIEWLIKGGDFNKEYLD